MRVVSGSSLNSSWPELTSTTYAPAWLPGLGHLAREQALRRRQARGVRRRGQGEREQRRHGCDQELHSASERREPVGQQESRAYTWSRDEQCRRDERSRPPPAAPSVQDGARAGRRRLHRRRLSDRCAAGARPAVGQPQRQPVRCLRGNQRRVADRVADGQRRDARADDARRQRAGADAVPEHRPRRPAAAQLRRAGGQGGAAAAAHGRDGARAGCARSAPSRRWT